MTLLWGSGSPPCWRIMITLEEKNLKGYKQKLLSFEKMEHKSQQVMDMNPRGQVRSLSVLNTEPQVCFFLVCTARFYLIKKITMLNSIFLQASFLQTRRPGPEWVLRCLPVPGGKNLRPKVQKLEFNFYPSKELISGRVVQQCLVDKHETLHLRGREPELYTATHHNGCSFFMFPTTEPVQVSGNQADPRLPNWAGADVPAHVWGERARPKSW